MTQARDHTSSAEEGSGRSRRVPWQDASRDGRGLRVTQVRSAIAMKPKHRGTVRALGLRGVGRTRRLPDRPEIRGMLARVRHLVSVEEVEEGEK